MTLKKLNLRPGVNREKTSYSNEDSWFECDKVRFRQGFAERIGGWTRISNNTFLGLCRSLFNWVTLTGANFLGVGTHLKFYVSQGGAYYDVTPLRATTAAGDVTFAATNGSSTLTVTDTAHGALVNDFVTFSGAATLGGLVTATVLNQEYQIASVVDANSYTLTAKDADGNTVTANASDSGNGGSSVVGKYQISVGYDIAVPISGWSGGTWGGGTWGTGSTSESSLRLWTQASFGEDLVIVPRGGSIYYWDSSNGTGNRAVAVSSLANASDVPTVTNTVLVSDVSRFVFCLGANTISTAIQDPLLIRWSDQESVVNWTPAATNQAGSLRLSQGSSIVTARQSRQEILVWTDSSLYALQYVGAPIVWSSQLVGQHTSIASQNAVGYANGVSYWMGMDKFYSYDGSIRQLRCDLRRHVFNDINTRQMDQVFAGTVEAFHEVWWFYCSKDSTTIDKYIVYNYEQDIWYYGTLTRTAWLDSGLQDFPLAATYNNNVVEHENGIDDNETTTPTAISANISSAQFDIDDGDRFSFVNRVVPDITFDGSTADNPAATLSLIPFNSSGSGISDPTSQGGSNSGGITRSAIAPVEKYTDRLDIRIRARQMSLKIESSGAGVIWQLGSPRIDIRADGRR
tara:strand:- start:3422 stop:5308 length:1887 start_codon:yes stop_codon:yes gene_type:complete